MKRSLMVLALLGTTALTPDPVYASPQAVAFVAGSLGVAGGTALATTYAATYASGALFAASAFGGFVVRTAVGIGLSFLANKLFAPDMPPPSARMVNFAQPKAYAEYAYGRTRKGGILGFTGFSDSKRYYVPILAAHEIEGFVEHWLDERVVTLNSETDTSLTNIDTSPIGGYGRIDTLDGASGQTANAGLVSAFTEITSAHDFAGLAGAVIWAKRPPQSSFSNIYPTGRQWAYAPVIDGANDIYDPRTDSTGYSNNAALVLAHWIVNRLGRDVDWDEVATEADVADTTVTNAESETQPLWTINGTISDEQEFEDQRAQMAAACDAFIYERADGKAGFKLGRWIEPTVSLSADDFFALELTEGQWGADAVDEVAVTYMEPENAWRETPSGVWVENDVAKAVRDEPQLYMINNHNQAARIAKRIAKTKRAKYQLKATIGMMGYELLGQRFFRLVHEEMGIDEYFEVGELVREGVSQFSVTANSVNASDFDFDAATEEPTRPTYSSVTSNDDIPDVSGLTATAVDGGSVAFSWTAADDSLVQQVRYRLTTETDWQVTTAPEGETQVVVTGLLDGGEYEYQARNRTGSYRVGNWAPDTSPIPSVTVIANSTAPAILDAFSATVDGSDVDLAFTAPNDPNYSATRIYRADDSTDFNDAVLIRTEYGAPNTADTWTDTAPGSGGWSYWAEPINTSGVAGTKSGPQSVTI
ncbi:fibronectin type III domain-containing protein [Aquicoccus sp. SU-CL01552]|uniref:fibronectin type III domain-containing protein n=1 Tax=Aquicoccus sp. SU-CL01552 TaxID=3127656 RepID=UPI00310641AF